MIYDVWMGRRDWRWLWEDVRLEILKRDKFSCQVCGFQDGKYAEKLEVHHIKPVSQGGKCLDEKNLITLCHECHKKTFNRFHNYGGIPKLVKQSKLNEVRE